MPVAKAFSVLAEAEGKKEGELMRMVIEKVLIRNKLINEDKELNEKKVKALMKSIADENRRVAREILI